MVCAKSRKTELLGDACVGVYEYFWQESLSPKLAAKCACPQPSLIRNTLFIRMLTEAVRFMKSPDTTTTPPLTFRKARFQEAERIASIVNSAYRGDSSLAGWTTEAHLLDGQRTDKHEIQRLIQDAKSMILLCLQDDEIIGSVLLQKKDDAAYLGMFVVKPELQGNGIGKHFISEVERIVQQEWGSSKIIMSVITLRHELIAFYQRRGYRRTGEILPFPDDPAAGVPLVQGLQFEMLEKDL
jgi:ribosomal protein S18 acetylase RimI-like enzyme